MQADVETVHPVVGIFCRLENLVIRIESALPHSFHQALEIEKRRPKLFFENLDLLVGEFAGVHAGKVPHSLIVYNYAE